VISDFYEEHKKEFYQLKNSSPFLTIQRYHNLEWRFDCVVASRAKLDQISPIITLRFETETSPESNFCHFNAQTDVSNLKQMIEVIEKAIVETKTSKMKKIQKVF